MSELSNIAKGATEWVAGAAKREAKAKKAFNKLHALATDAHVARMDAESSGIPSYFEHANDALLDYEREAAKHIKDPGILNNSVANLAEGTDADYALGQVGAYLNLTKHMTPEVHSTFHAYLPAHWASKALGLDKSTIGSLHTAKKLTDELNTWDPAHKETFLKLLPEWNGSIDELKVASRLL